MPDTLDLDSLEVLFGHATPAEARVYVRLKKELPPDARLTGSIRGPKCLYQHTLQAEVTLEDRGPGEGLLAEALVVDPCFWTPASPFLYRLNVELAAKGETLAREERWFGLRHLGVADGRVRWDYEPYVIRAIRIPEPPLEELPAWRDEQRGVVLSRASDVFCEEAGRVGVPLVVEVTGTASTCLEEIKRLAQWPAVMMAIVSCDEPLADAAMRCGLLLGWRASDSNAAAPDWAQVVICPLEEIRTDPQRAVMVEAADRVGDRNAATSRVAELVDATQDRLQTCPTEVCGYLL